MFWELPGWGLQAEGTGNLIDFIFIPLAVDYHFLEFRMGGFQLNVYSLNLVFLQIYFLLHFVIADEVHLYGIAAGMELPEYVFAFFVGPAAPVLFFQLNGYIGCGIAVIGNYFQPYSGKRLNAGHCGESQCDSEENGYQAGDMSEFDMHSVLMKC